MNNSRAVPIAAVGAVMLIVGLAAGSIALSRTETTTRVLTTNVTDLFTTTTTTTTVSATTFTVGQSSTDLSALCPKSSPELNATSPYPYGEGVRPLSFHINENSTMFACVAFYYYNSTSPITIDPVDSLSLSAMINNSEINNNALTNFSILSSAKNVTIGDSAGANEGSVVTFLIHSKPVSNGTYVFDLGWTFNPGPYACTTDYYLVVGNGIPDYSYQGSCITMTVTGSGGASSIPQGVVFTKLLKVGNFTNSS